MKMTFRWFGTGFDKVPLEHIRQIPGMTGVVPMLSDIPVGETWPLDRILELKREIESHGLAMEVIESVNVHEDIKLGLPSRDRYIDNYIDTLGKLGKAGVKVVCYNFMPVFDWTRTTLARVLPDGSTTLSFDAAIIDGVDPQAFVAQIQAGSNGLALPGWEPERLAVLSRLFEAYKGVGPEELWSHLEYFLKAVIPAAERAGIRMGIHPDDPPWSIFGLPRIITGEKSLERLVSIVDSPSNGITLCSGSLGADAANDIPALVRRFGAMNRIPFGHVRNVARRPAASPAADTASGTAPATAPATAGMAARTGASCETPHYDFYESAHRSAEGSLDMFAIMKAYHDVGFDGWLRPDHGRMIWGEQGRPGYGLYDRALGAVYLQGLWEALEKGGL